MQTVSLKWWSRISTSTIEFRFIDYDTVDHYVIIIYYFIDDCDFFSDCKAVTSTMHNRYDASYEQIKNHNRE